MNTSYVSKSITIITKCLATLFTRERFDAQMHIHVIFQFGAFVEPFRAMRTFVWLTYGNQKLRREDEYNRST